MSNQQSQPPQSSTQSQSSLSLPTAQVPAQSSSIDERIQWTLEQKQKQSKNWFSKRRYYLLFLCFLNAVVSYADRTNMAVAILPMSVDLRWTQSERGFVLSSFFYGYLCTQILGGYLAVRYGGQKVLAISCAFWSLFTCLTPPAARHSRGVLFICRVGLGLAEGMGFPSIMALISRHVPAREYTRAIGFVLSGCYLGAVIANLVAGPLMEKWGWPSIFYVFGSIGLLWLIPWLFWLDLSKMRYQMVNAVAESARASPIEADPSLNGEEVVTFDGTSIAADQRRLTSTTSIQSRMDDDEDGYESNHDPYSAGKSMASHASIKSRHRSVGALDGRSPSTVEDEDQSGPSSSVDFEYQNTSRRKLRKNKPSSDEQLNVSIFMDSKHGIETVESSLGSIRETDSLLFHQQPSSSKSTPISPLHPAATRTLSGHSLADGASLESSQDSIATNSKPQTGTGQSHDDSRGKSSTIPFSDIPWRQLFSTREVWAIIVVQFCMSWSFWLLINWMPTYYENVFKVDIKHAGFFTVIPYIVQGVSGNLVGILADTMMNRWHFSKLFVRRFMQASGMIIQSAFMLLAACVPNVYLGMTCMALAMSAYTLTFAGVSVNHLDIAPRYSSVVYGIGNTSGQLPGIIGVWFTGWLLDVTGNNWMIVFSLAACISLIGAVSWVQMVGVRVVVE